MDNARIFSLLTEGGWAYRQKLKRVSTATGHRGRRGGHGQETHPQRTAKALNADRIPNKETLNCTHGHDMLGDRNREY